MLLNGTLSLHDIEDVEAFCIWVMGSTQGLAPHESEDCLAYLVASTWELSLVYDHSIGTFATFARSRVRRRLLEYLRQRKGRTRWVNPNGKKGVYERPLPTFVSLEHRPDGADHSFEMDSSTYRLASQLGLLGGRGSAEPWQIDGVGEDQASRAA